jgi:hypothetical protein
MMSGSGEEVEVTPESGGVVLHLRSAVVSTLMETAARRKHNAMCIFAFQANLTKEYPLR